MSAAAEQVETNVHELPARGDAPHVYRAVADIMGELAKTGIAKGRKNQQQGFAFRGIDDVYNALAGLLAKHRLVALPLVESRECVERQTKNGGALYFTTVRVRYSLVSAVDGTRHEVTVDGEAMDSADKATNKAMSAAYKYMCLQVFCIPTEGDNDADATTHEVSAIMPAAEFDKLKARVAESGGDPVKWEAYIAKQYPQGVPMAAHAKVSADIEAAKASREKKAAQP